jgi:hypothetical protein
MMSPRRVEVDLDELAEGILCLRADDNGKAHQQTTTQEGTTFMSTIDLTDPNDASSRGGLSSPDPISWQAVLAGTPANFIIDEFTSSGEVKELFDLSPPPSFLGPFLVWGEIDTAARALALFLAPSTGDRSFPFATLDGFVSAVDGSGGALSGSGSLQRSNRLPPKITWTLNP